MLSLHWSSRYQVEFVQDLEPTRTELVTLGLPVGSEGVRMDA
jgi:hypothetical protein